MRNLLKISGLLAITVLLGLMGAAAIRRSPDLLKAMWSKSAPVARGTTTSTVTSVTRSLSKEEYAQHLEDARRDYESDAPMPRFVTSTISMREQSIKAGNRKVVVSLSAKVYNRQPAQYFWSVLILDANKEIVWEHDCFENVLTTDGIHPIRPSIAEEISLDPGRYTVEYHLNAVPAGVVRKSPLGQRDMRGKQPIEILESDEDTPPAGGKALRGPSPHPGADLGARGGDARALIR